MGSYSQRKVLEGECETIRGIRLLLYQVNS